MRRSLRRLGAVVEVTLSRARRLELLDCIRVRLFTVAVPAGGCHHCPPRALLLDSRDGRRVRTAAGLLLPTTPAARRSRDVRATDTWPPVSSLRSRTLVWRLAMDSGAGGLEELDRVAGGVLEQDLPAARPADDVVAERQAGRPQPIDLGPDVLDDEMDAVPASRLRRSAIGHRPPG